MSSTMLAAPRLPFSTTTPVPGGSIHIEDREELIYLLSEAAELEHAACATYLFAAFGLKTEEGEGLANEQVRLVSGWKRTIVGIAIQEMAHLTLVNNVLSAVGGAPHFSRPSFPRHSRYAPAIQLELTRLDERTLERFLYIERPEGMDIAALARDISLILPQAEDSVGLPIVPQPQAFATVGDLYRGVEEGIRRLSSRLGEAGLFIGSPAYQATSEQFRMPDVTPVTGLASALRAIETIVAEGEGQRGNWRDAHFGRFASMLKSYREIKAANPSFTPSRTVAPNPYAHPPSDLELGARITLIEDPVTREVADLFDACYDLMLQLLERCFAHGEEDSRALATLADLSVGLMSSTLAPLGELLTQLPTGPDLDGLRAGPSFRTEERTRISPHMQEGWHVLHERMLELSKACELLVDHPVAGRVVGAVSHQLARTAERLRLLA